MFERFHSRIDYYRDNVGVLDAANQVAVAAFCAMGGRSSPHSVSAFGRRVIQLQTLLSIGSRTNFDLFE